MSETPSFLRPSKLAMEIAERLSDELKIGKLNPVYVQHCLMPIIDSYFGPLAEQLENQAAIIRATAIPANERECRMLAELTELREILKKFKT